MKKLLKPLLILLGFILSIGITYILIPRPYQVHWHANFAVFIDGQAWDFSKDIYMEEVSRCNITEGVEPADRIHLHENKGDLVHVHMAASTWGDLLHNLMWNAGTNYLVDDYGKMYTTGSGKNIYYFINDEQVLNPINITVESEDRLLIYYGTGTADEVLSTYTKQVPQTAHEYNQKADPASCGSNTYGIFSSIAEPIHEWFEHSHN